MSDFDGHVITVVLARGRGDAGPIPQIECKEANIDSSPCEPDFCQMQEVYNVVGWEAFSMAGEIELSKLSARMDWRDPDEPWIEVEP